MTTQPPLELLGDCQFTVNGLSLAARQWGRVGATPVLAIHGWLDNAASFYPLAEHLRDLHLVAVDCAGHGLSGRRSADAGYNIWQDVGELFAVMDQLGWQRCHLLGHSRGAAIASLMAGTFPDRVERLLLIDGMVPAAFDPRSAHKQLAKAITEHQRYRHSQPSMFASYEAAVAARANGFLAVELGAAALLAERGVSECEQGFYWHNDQRLKAASELKLSSDNLAGFLGAITAPTLLIEAQQGVLAGREREHQLFNDLKHLRSEVLPGGHHLHLEQQAPQVAAVIQQFIAESPL